MISTWTQHLKTDEDRENFKRQIYGSVDVLDRLADICQQRLTQLELEEKDFNIPNWDYNVANLIGRRTELKAMLTLLDHRSIK